MFLLQLSKTSSLFMLSVAKQKRSITPISAEIPAKLASRSISIKEMCCYPSLVPMDWEVNYFFQGLPVQVYQIETV